MSVLFLVPLKRTGFSILGMFKGTQALGAQDMGVQNLAQVLLSCVAVRKSGYITEPEFPHR